MRILKGSKIVRLSELPNGSLFSYRNTIALKSEYRTASGACECYIVGLGEMFWGGTSKSEDLNHLPVTPLLLVED